MTKIDDSDLFHSGRRYDPEKARAYYMRTRQLKGQRTGSSLDDSSGRSRASSEPAPKKPTPRSQEIAEERAKLERRLDRLRDILAELVEAAKSRSGVEKKENDDPKKSSAKTETSSEKKDKTPDKKTATEKASAAKKAREHYEKNRPAGVTPKQELSQLRAKVADIQRRIDAAMERKENQTPNKSNDETA